MVVVVKRLNVLTTCREYMVIDKHKYLIGPASGLYFHLLCTSFLMRAHAGAESSYSVVEDGDPDPQPGKKGGNVARVTLRVTT